jgi:TP901 family phage tail tape measure protein
MADRSVVVKLIANVSDYRRNLSAAADDTAKFTAKNKQNMEQVGKAGLALGTGLAVGVGLALKKFADFDQAMSNIQAATHESAQGMNTLREAALEAGARTAFSAVEAADAIEQLAKAGVATADILNGGLNGALDLAAAGGLAVGDAAEIAATAMTQFKLEGSQIPHVADLLAAAAGKAQGDVSDMGQALKQAGLVASQTGLSIEETTAGLASFAAAGLLGSDAGTSFKAMLQRLTPQSAEAESKMRELGISAYDAQGNFVGLEAFAGNLQDSLAGLTVEQRNSAMATIFGSDAVRAASVLYSQGAEGIAEWTGKVNDAGYAQETAAIKLDNLKGDIEAFLGSLETALIRTGEHGNGLARSIVQNATEITNAYGEMSPKAQAATLAVGGTVGAASLAAGGFLLLAPRIMETRRAMADLATEMPKVTGAMRGIGRLAGTAAVLLAVYEATTMLTAALEPSAPSVDKLTASLVTLAQTGKVTGEALSVFGEDLTTVQDSINRLSDDSTGDKIRRFFGFDKPFSDNGNRLEEDARRIDALGESMARLVDQGHPEIAAEALKTMGLSVNEATAAMPAYDDALARASASAALAAEDQEGLGGAVEGATGAVVEQTESLGELMEKVRALSEQILGLRGSSRSYEAALDDATKALKENGKTLDITTEKGRDNEAALDAIASAASDVLDSMVASGKPISDVTAKFGQQRAALIKAAESFGMTTAEAEVYADSVLRIPDKKTTTITLTGAEAALAQVQRLREYLAGITNKTVTVRVDQVLGATVARGVPGRVIERASGGYVPGQGTDTSDNIPALLSPGEYVLRAASVRKIGLPTLDRLNRFATGGPVGYAAGGSVNPVAGTTLALAAGRLTTVERVRALVNAWKDYNDQLAQAARRTELVNDAKAAKRTFDLAKGMKDRTAALADLNEANKRLREFDAKAAIDAELRAVDLLVDRLAAEADARDKAQKAAEDLAKARQEAAEAAQDEADRALAALSRMLDQEQSVRARLARSVEAFRAGQAALAARRVDERARYDKAEQSLRQAQAKAEAEHLERMHDLGVQFTDDQARILADRRDRLANATALDQAIDFRRGLPADWLVRNARRQVEALAEWMEQLDLARRMGVSEAVIEALGLDEGPQALAQVRALTRASAQEIHDLNSTVEERTRLAGEQVRREQVGNYGQLGQALVAAQQQYANAVLAVQADYRAGQERFAADLLEIQANYVQAQRALDQSLADLQGEFLAEQASLTAELERIGLDQGRSFGEAIAEGMRSQIPAVRAAAQALAQAMADLAAAQTATQTPAVPPATGGTGISLGRQRGPFIHPGGTASNPMNLVDPNAKPGTLMYGVIRQTYDSGGWLQPGYTLAYNGTGAPERVLTAGQAEGRTINVMPGAQVTLREAVDVDLLLHRAEFLVQAGSM